MKFWFIVVSIVSSIISAGLLSDYSLGSEIAKNIIKIRTGDVAFASNNKEIESGNSQMSFEQEGFYSISGLKKKELTPEPKPKEVSFGIKPAKTAPEWTVKKLWVDLDNTIELIPEHCDKAREQLSEVVFYAKKRGHVTTELARQWVRYTRLTHCFDMELAKNTIQRY